MIRSIFSAAALAALAILLIAAGSNIVVSGQLLDYESGYVFFTTGDGFRVAPDVAIRDAVTHHATTLEPGPRIWARATFDPVGNVIELDLSRAPLPPEGSFADVSRFAVALSPPLPNPDLRTPPPAATSALGGPLPQHPSGKPVLVTFDVQVPPNTPFTSTVYMATDQSGWNAQAIPMERIDALHYEITERLAPGTILRYLYDRGSFQQEEIAENGLQRDPRELIVQNADVRLVRDTVFAWLDTLGGGFNQNPQAIPTPYNPAPFPNLPGGFPSPRAPPAR